MQWRSGGVWTQQGQKLVGTGADGFGQQGTSVAISGDGNTVIVGCPGDNIGVGASWIWTRSGGIWTQQGQKLIGTGAVANSNQGAAVALSADGNTAIIGGPGDDPSATSPGDTSVGAVWVWTRSGGVWTQQGAKLVGTGAAGAGTAGQGASVALSGDGNTAIVGGPADDPNTGGFLNWAGAAWVYTRSGGVWTQQGPKLVGAGAVGGAVQGISVALSYNGGTGLVGGWADDPVQAFQTAGAAWVYVQRPQVTKVTPNSGSNQGGTHVTIEGAHFIAGSSGGTKITFAGNPASVVNCSSTTQCTTTSPFYGDTAIASTVDVQADVNGPISSPSPNDHFTYTAGPNCTWSLSCAERYAGYPSLHGQCTSTVNFINSGSTTSGTSYSTPTGTTPGALLKACNPTTGSCVSHSTFQVQYGYCGMPPPGANQTPACTNLDAEIAATMKLISQYNAILQSGGSVNKTDIENGLEDANVQLAGLEQQVLSMGCPPLGSPVKTPVKSP
jgi:hypothetical protein